MDMPTTVILDDALIARVATTAGAKNHALVTSLGADVAIDYRTTRFETVAKDQDVVLDTQGGDTLLRSFEVVTPGGVVVTIGGRPDGKFARAHSSRGT
jgi:NADPH:quinone reductase-like Zn-dependent oxidoreductase